MDNQGEDFPGGSPPGRNNNNVRGGSGLHNDLFSSSLRSMDPQYAAALDFEELRMRRQLEVQQDIEFRRRLMEEQQQQLLSELEYRNKIQQLQEIQELQAQQQQQQQQQQGLNQILAQNPRLLEMHQQQQYHSGRDNSLLSSLREDFLLQRHQLMLQDQMQQQLQEQLSRDSQQKEQEDLLAMLQASGNLRGASSLPADVASLRQEEASSLRQEEASSLRQEEVSLLRHQKEAFQQPPAKEPSPAPPKPPPTEPAPAPASMDELLNNANIQRAESASTNQERVQPQTDVDPGTKKRNINESANETGKDAHQDPPLEKEKTPANKSPQIEPSPAEDAAPKAEPPAKDDRSAKDRELDAKVAQLLESQKLPAAKKVAQLLESQKLLAAKQKAKGAPEKKGKKKKGKAEEKAKNNGGRKRKTPAASPAAKKSGKKEGQGDDAGKVTDQEQSVIDFLGSRGTKNGKLKRTAEKAADQSGPKKRIKGGKDAKEKEQKDDEAVASLVMNLKRSGVTTDEVQDVKKWSREVAAQGVPPEKIPFHRRPGLKFNLPSLPVEPELTDADSVSATPSTNDPPTGTSATAVGSESNSSAEPSASDGASDIVNAGAVRFISAKKKIFKPKRSGKGHDEWWPSNALIRKENRKRGARQDEEDTDEEADAAGEPDVSFVKAGVDAAKKRLAGSVEPGVLEKLPHCKLYNEFREKNGGEWVPKFCCQTTETFPSEAMVCCSVCSTWRHAQCGGHYRRYTPNSVHPSNVVFQPVCDQCYFEKRFVDGNATAEMRLERQRIQHLRRCNATNSVVRQVAFGKHSGQYKWPLGSVSVSHISGHTRSVQARHEKAEKQWSEMAARLGTGQELKPRERQRVRTRELERLFVSIEDAEGVMDRHNMALFLQSDTSKLHPAGFEVPRRNMFDPSDDPVYVSVLKDPTDPTESLEDLDDSNSDDNQSSKAEPVPNLTNLNKRNGVSPPCAKEENANPMDQKTDKNCGDDAGDGDPSNANKCHTCSREGCTQRPRFDSIFCSDSCGVSTLETDLLRSLQCAAKLHPSLLRS